MSLDPAGDARETGQSFTLGEGNTFSFLPGPMLGVSCPACFHDQLLKEVVSRGACTHCDTELELTLTARIDGASESG